MTTELGRSVDALAAELDPDSDVTTVTEELIAMRQISKRLDGLDGPARGRVLRWLTARYDKELSL